MVGFGCWRKLLLHIDNNILILHCKCLPGWSMHCICQMGKLSSPQKFSLADSGCWPFAIHHRDCNGNMHCLMHCTMYMNSAFNSVVRSKLECPTKLCPLKGLRLSGPVTQAPSPYISRRSCRLGGWVPLAHSSSFF